MKILVTGGNGFLGSRIVRRLLAQGHVVDIYARSVDSKNSTDNSLHIPGDLTDREQLLRAVEGKDAVFHVAAKAGVWGRRRDYFDTNVTGTRNVVAACGVHGVKTLIYTSTPSVVFGSASLEGANEEAPYATRFLTHYAETKCIAEKEVLSVNGLGALRTIALRPHLIWGPGDPHLVPRVLTRARAGKLKRVGDGTNKVDITHVEDAADAHILAFEKLSGTGQQSVASPVEGARAEHGSGEPCHGKAYFISSETINLWHWIGELLKRAGLPALTRQVSRGAAYRVGALLELVYGLFGIAKEPPMTRFVAENLATSHWFDISRARQNLGYEPKRFGEAALDDYLQTEKAHASH